MRLIWSFGQVYPDYFHSPNSGIEAETVSNTMFYQPDEIKYHGTRNRGATSINFFGELTLPRYEKIPGKWELYILPLIYSLLLLPILVYTHCK